MKLTLWLIILSCIPAWAQDITITELKTLNSPYRETNVNIAPDGSTLYFTSGRGGMPWSYSKHVIIDGLYEADGDLWYSNKVNNQFTIPLNMGLPINTDSGEDEVMISTDGKLVIFESWGRPWEHTGGPYYMADRKGRKWTNVRGFSRSISRFFLRTGFDATDGASISPDLQTFVFAAGQDYTGPMDIYICKKEAETWSYPEKLSFCTEADERNPFIAADGLSLYFASDGLKGKGGLDIYMTRLLEPFNIKPLPSPLNTEANDNSFVISRDGKNAYMIRNANIYLANVEPLAKELKPLNDEQPLTLYFPFDDFHLDTANLQKLKDWFPQEGGEDYYFEISGHTDVKGSDTYNEELSKKRAQACLKQLLDNMVSPNKIMQTYYGERMPISDDPALNRRVELKKYKL